MAMASPQVSMKGNSLYNLVLMANYIFSEILFLLLNAVSSMILKDYWFHFLIEYAIMSKGVMILWAAGDRSSKAHATWIGFVFQPYFGTYYNEASINLVLNAESLKR